MHLFIRSGTCDIDGQSEEIVEVDETARWGSLARIRAST